jgi:uncharacterized CHY-type Zn-finger protein
MESTCKHCKDIIEIRKCKSCRKTLSDECQECHNEIEHKKIGPSPISKNFS